MITHCDPAQLPEASSHEQAEDHILEAWCPACAHAVDAQCPECRSYLEPAGVATHGRTPSVLQRTEFYRRFILLIQNARNSKFTLGCFLIATGDAFADGISMAAYARTWSVKKATVSKQCNYICRYLGLPPSRYMRGAETKPNYRAANTRPRKLPHEKSRSSSSPTPTSLDKSRKSPAQSIIGRHRVPSRRAVGGPAACRPHR